MTSVLSHDPRLPKPKRKAKYGNKITMVGDLRFHSLGEAARWQQLKLLERVKKISGLERQVRYPLSVNGVEIGVYVADFVYGDKSVHGWRVIEDFKGHDSPLSKWKRAHLKAEYGTEVTITGKRKTPARRRAA